VKSGWDKMLKKRVFGKWRGYLQGLGLVVLATLLGHLVRDFFAPANIIMIYLLCVTVSAVLWGLGPSVLVSILSVLTFDFFFVPPFFTFAVAHTQYVFTFIVLLLVGIIISFLTSRARQQTEAARQREQETAALYALSRDLSVSYNLESYVQAIAKRIKETLECDAIIFLPDIQNEGTLKPFASSANVIVDGDEFSAATSSFEHQRIIGHGTHTFPNVKSRYLPMLTARGVVGVLAIRLADTTKELTIEQERLLGAYADLAAVAIEGILLAEEAHNAQVLRATEKLQTALLNAISHDLRTPLVSIIGVLSSLQEEGMVLDDAAKKNLIQVAREEAERLNHLITNLLNESRIEAGVIKISKQSSEVQDLVGAALEQLSSRSSTHPVKIDIPVDLPFISVDFDLIVQTLVNILDNAFKYSPPGSLIEITGRRVAEKLYLEVADRGVGIPPQDLLRVFDKFYRVQRPNNVAGTGLGLSICKGIVEAHGGQIEAANRLGGGTIIRLILPVGKPSSLLGEKTNG
jgi:two-component system sensor histidine kinase KdpD